MTISFQFVPLYFSFTTNKMPVDVHSYLVTVNPQNPTTFLCLLFLTVKINTRNVHTFLESANNYRNYLLT